MTARERGSASLELSLGMAVLVLPLVMALAMLPLWLEREAVAALAAREGARAFVLAGEQRQAVREAEHAAMRIAAGHGIVPADFTVRVSGTLARGAVATVSASVRVPAVTVPLLGPIGGFTITREHREVVDPYRSW